MHEKSKSTLNAAHIEIDHKKCISCFCCQEICPEKAVTLC
jgi:formate hydrogenlyase subunit 6/NADH:ubiquinone oxidoreductase subunit I